jgi:hypothetical protein
MMQILIALVLLHGGAAPARAEIRTSFLKDHDPEIHIPEPINVISPRLKLLWLEALSRPETDMQRMAADAIMRGHAFGISGLEDAIPRLETLLSSAATHPAARLAVARSLVELRATACAASMADSARLFGADLRQVIEPALAQWDYRPMRDVWKARLKVPQVRHSELMLAIRCLITARDESAAGALLEFVHDAERGADVRIEAARSAGMLAEHGLEADTRLLIARGNEATKLNRLCGVQLVARHAGDDAIGLLTEFAVDAEPAIAAIALGRLIEIDPHLALPLAAGAIQNADAKVRRHGARTYMLLPNPDRIGVLAGMLNDPHPELRSSVREWLYELARVPELDESVRRFTTAILAADDWRGLEQAALLLAALDHKPAAPRLVELVDYRRPEVRIAAAWGAKTLAVPETLPALLKTAQQRTETRMGPVAGPNDLDEQTAHLLEFFGKMRYREAEPLLRQYVPKVMPMGVHSRAAAIWSLGFLHEGVPDESLAETLMDRLRDPVEGQGAEWSSVKEMSAVSIARMKALSQVTPLRKFVGSMIRPDRQGMAIRWALMEMTGESIPEPKGSTLSDSAIWFLESLDDQ